MGLGPGALSGDTFATIVWCSGGPLYDYGLTEAEVTAREYAEIENIEKGGPIANADYTINNDNDPAEMLQHLDNLLTDTGFYSTV